MIRLIVLSLLLTGCLHQVRPCPPPDIAGFVRTVDEITTLRANGQITADLGRDLLALEALSLRAEMRRCQ